MKKTRLFGFLYLVVALLLVPGLRAQTLTASITGNVTDTSGAVVPGVHVTLKNPATGVSYETVTNAEGSYTITQMKPGPGYEAKFSLQGFQTVIVTGLYLNVAATRTQNASLKVGNVVQTVSVSASNQNETLNTTDATVGNNFQVQFLNDLPVENRDSPAALFSQQPGITSGGGTTGNLSVEGAVTGARTDQDNVTLDGLDVNDNETGNFGAIVANAPVDSVQEFRGTTAGELANAGEGGGGQFQLVTRGGTNHFHGALVEYHRDTDLEANDWFNNNAGVSRPPLIRNQFGSNVGGPILKDKLFFFFDYNGRRDTLSNLVTRVVPVGDASNTSGFRGGYLNYLNASGSQSTLTPAQVASYDPQHVGFDPGLLSFIDKRYPAPNDFSGACDNQWGVCPDLVNTAGYRFNAPYPYKEDDYVLRFDYTLNSTMKLWAVGHVTRTTGTQNAIQFPGDPQTYPFIDRSSSWAIAHSWTIGARKFNQAEYGETYEDYQFPNTYNPEGANQFETFGGNGTGGSILSMPYARAINAQGRTFPLPVVRDDFTWLKGRHSFNIGGSFKWASPNNTTILDYNTPTIGLSTTLPGLNATLRPADIGGAEAQSLYDSAFAAALGVYTQVGATYNYNAQGNPLPQGTGSHQDFRYYETEIYFEDSWKVLPSLTLSYGLRYQNYTVPYERNGIESVDQFGTPGGQLYSVKDSTFNNYFSQRVAQSAKGESGDLAVPLFDYVLGGKANNAPGLYQPNNLDFAPRVGFAWNPSFDRKSVFSGGAGIIYDHTVINSILYQQTQFDYLFEAPSSRPLGGGDPTTSLENNPRFDSLTSGVPAAAPAPSVARPYYPWVDSSSGSPVPYGLADGQAFNEMIDPSFKTPYSIAFNFGWQHEFPQGFILKTDYVGRLGRRLMAQADSNQLIDFPDTVSGQMMSQAFQNISVELRNNQPVTEQPWFENVLPPGFGAAYGASHPKTGITDNTSLVTYFLGTYVGRGDFADTMEGLSNFGLLPSNVGMGSQFSENTMYTNKGFSAYNGLLVTLHKNASHGLQFDLNYTWSHSIDNVSAYANQIAYGGYGFACDVLRPRECRGNSDFDIRNEVNGNFIYQLPFGHGQPWGANSSRWLNEAIGGWELSGLPTWHTGYPFFAASNAFVAGYANNAPALLTTGGSLADMQMHIHGGKGGPLYAYSNTSKANSDYQGPLGFTIGSRNNLTGPGYFNMDLGLGKTFPIAETWQMVFRADAFNALNHPSFSAPCTDITDASCQFGVISSDTNPARVLQGALRLEF